MDIFKTQINVEGKVICGNVSNGKFYLNMLNPSNSVIPSIRPIEFNKEWLDITIAELKAVREQL